MSGFAAKMMATIGYIVGQGLGKQGEGILAPVEATTIASKQFGFGYTETFRPHAAATEEVNTPKVDSSTAMRIRIHNSLPEHIAKISAITIQEAQSKTSSAKPTTPHTSSSRQRRTPRLRYHSTVKNKTTVPTSQSSSSAKKTYPKTRDTSSPMTHQINKIQATALYVSRA
ncbi:hypothetical protein BU23DRAFT_557978 [Bimuria novae-zelandiae CBS 107.79]|uniref:G-patch domain-containing protein n=1 Tax=Bimuria novae-zelandiae CBS 107.79 TaxID=1447943 RepID=A0A6A5UYQ2_9PLEO|nr:hypothetical protein BU23DRAFT_557978 [Bimuria novae-zelandiae CBS 107.79]